MPSTKGLEVLVRREQLSDDHWFRLIEARRELIKPYLDSFTLAELGSFKCLRLEGYYHEIGLDRPKVTGEQGFSLKTQGIFGEQPYKAVVRIPGSGYQPGPGSPSCCDGKILVWGLERSNRWIVATIDFAGEAGYKGRGYERAKSVEIVAIDDVRILIHLTKVDPRELWETIGRQIKNFSERREFLYKQALDLARMVEVEELALSLLLKRS